ncbi:hypothetical protein HDF16_006197 [Granulicella aggregans]|uniref:Uncharacterized protein n=1 Tax=Granulicella aggregans TaxID=474949 RepID=A0A7W7ZK87_9BACT|nr:hypothetical protein [Granulicella aggregans]MBB5061461.1 hypothetical protein [Granulicella aggregans]
MNNEVEDLLSRCIHFNGAIGGRCEAGISYKELVGSDSEFWARIPCRPPLFKFEGAAIRFPIVPCEKKTTVSREIAEEKARLVRHQLQQRLNISKIVRDLANAKGFGRQPEGQSGSSELQCPVCITGTLRYAVDGATGKLAASCTTGDCVRWQEEDRFPGITSLNFK